MLAGGGDVPVEPAESIHPSMRLPTVSKRYEDDPGKMLVLNKGLGFNHQRGC